MNGQGKDPTRPGFVSSALDPERGPSPWLATSEVADKPTVPDYDLLRRIGGGAYGDVWLARSKATGVLRAAKIVWRRTFDDDRPFQREFDGIQRFEQISREHPSQLALFHIGRNVAEGYFYYIMELADDVAVQSPKSKAEAKTNHAEAISSVDSQSYSAHTLRADLAHGRLPAARVLEIGLALSEALGHLHEKGLVHRDVKPSNVIFVNGRPKLADIGLVTDASDQCSIVGTEGYLPPEGPGTPQADIFALGKVLYEAATGMDRRRFPELPEDLRNWPEHRAVIELNEIVLRACAKDPASRYSSCREMHDELGHLGEGRSIKNRRLWRQRLLIVRNVGIAAMALALATAGGVYLWRLVRGYDSRVVVVEEGGQGLSRYDARAVEAYEAGRRALRRGTPEGRRQAQERLSKAITLEPSFTDAYARLFETFLLSEDRGMQALPGKTEKLNDLAATLQRMAPTNADTHAAVAIVKFLNEWKWKEADEQFQQALSIDKNCRMALTYYGYFLTRLRRSDEAKKYLEQADKAYPASPDVAKLLGHCEYARRHFEDALNHYLSAEELGINYPSAYYWAGRADMALTNYFDAIRQLQNHEVLEEYDKTRTAARYETYQKAVEKENDPEGQARAFWAALIEDLKPNESNTSTPYLYAARYIRVGEVEQAQKWLNLALAKHDGMENLLFDECWDPYRREKWFKELVKKVGLEPWQ